MGGMGLDLVGIQHPRVDELLRHRVIAREPRQAALAQQVEARISGMTDEEAVAGGGRRRERGAHARAVFPYRTLLGDGAIDGREDRIEPRHDLSDFRLADRHEPSRALLREFERAAECQRARHFAGGVAAHAVGDRERPEGLCGHELQIVCGNVRGDRRGDALDPDREESVLVVRALTAFRTTGNAQHQGWQRRVLRRLLGQRRRCGLDVRGIHGA